MESEVKLTGDVKISYVRKKHTGLGFRIARRVLKVLKWIVVAVCLIACIAVIVLWARVGPTISSYYKEAVSTVANSTVSDFRRNNNSYVYDDAGNQLAKLSTDRDVDYVKYSELPEGILDAFVAIEDKRFYQHSGVDWKSTAKAAYLLVANNGAVSRGGSTITQQLARNVFLSFETSYERKIREIFIALELEKKYSKSEILEFYINNINYSNGYYGIGTAASGYFSKSVAELSVQEIAFLCAIPNNPTYYNPLKNFDHTITRRNVILREMCSQGFLTEKEYLKAVNSGVTLVQAEESFYNYESSFAIKCAVLEFMRMQDFDFRYSFSSMDDYSVYKDRYDDAYDEAKQLLYTGGYRIKTSISASAQATAQESLDTALAGSTDMGADGIYDFQGACTVVDNSTGLVVAIVGGRTQDVGLEGVMTFNRAYQSYKQPGSTIKPLIVYAPAMEQGYTPSTTVNDVAIANGPENSDGKFLGSMSLRRAVELSRNAVAWSLFTEITPEYGLGFVQKMQFSKIVPDDFYASAALGGLTYGVSTVEMASAYSTLGNDGVYRGATCITSIKDSDGREVYKKSKDVAVYTESVAHNMLDVLQGVATSGTAAGLCIGDGMPVACKTGTTNKQTCGWFCGLTPYYTVAVYVGSDSGKTNGGLWGSTYPCTVWKSIQERLCEGKEIVPLFSGAEEAAEAVEEPVVEVVEAVEEPVEEAVEEPVTPVEPVAPAEPVAPSTPETEPVAPSTPETEKKPTKKPVKEPEPEPPVEPETPVEPVEEPEPESEPEPAEPEPPVEPVEEPPVEPPVEPVEEPAEEPTISTESVEEPPVTSTE